MTPDNLVTIAASALRPGDTVYVNGVRECQLVTPLDEKGRAAVDR
jgi:hypothetical protein